ncbi:MAG TPA: murein L,D-transpeptidase catalytic domain family protein [Flavisolibacter sp.]|nr:murein L,D-transpeptidase catalytic domain family protein [Flavisolibacter sp.]
MRKAYLPLSFVCLLCSFLLLPVVKAGSNSGYSETITSTDNNTAKASGVEYYGNLLYDSLHLEQMGMKKDALMYAYKGQQNLLKKGKISNEDVLTVCDFSQPSDRKRLYIIDVRNFKVLLNTYVAHGKNSGELYASRFSNRPRSLASSLGFYVTKGTYFGKHGLSMKLSGLDKGYNDRAESRAIVVHGATYIGDEWLGGKMGRSFGCPAVPLRMAPKVIDLIKNGTCLFIYHPLKSYLHGSNVLNG